MTKFSEIWKKPQFGPFWVLFAHFRGNEIFIEKIQLCQAELHVGFYPHAKN